MSNYTNDQYEDGASHHTVSDDEELDVRRDPKRGLLQEEDPFADPFRDP